MITRQKSEYNFYFGFSNREITILKAGRGVVGNIDMAGVPRNVRIGVMPMPGRKGLEFYAFSTSAPVGDATNLQVYVSPKLLDEINRGRVIREVVTREIDGGGIERCGLELERYMN